MRHLRSVLILFTSALVFQLIFSATNSQATPYFTKNMGQWPDSILFRAEANGSVMWFVKDGIYHQFFRKVERENNTADASNRMNSHTAFPEDPRFERDSIETTMIKAQFVGANPNVEVVGIDEVEYKCSYFLGNDKSKWAANVPNYRGIEYFDLATKSVVLFTKSDNNNLIQIVSKSDVEKFVTVDLFLRPGVKYSLASEYSPISSIESDALEKLSESYRSYGQVGQDDLPTEAGSVQIVYSTFLGGSDHDQINSMTLDHVGQPYVCGVTLSSNFPAINSVEPAGSGTIFVSKLNLSGGGPVYTTFFGGEALDQPSDIKVDRFGRTYIVGLTQSLDYPTVNSLQPYSNFGDLFIAKLSSGGNALLFSSYLGGSQNELPGGIWVDTTTGRVTIAGTTFSSDFPVVNPIQSFQTGPDLLVSVIETSTPTLLFSTTIGGSGSDRSRRVCRDSIGCIIIAGSTTSPDFPFRNELLSLQDTLDMLVMRLSPLGDSIQFATAIGGNSEDLPFDMTLDSDENILVVGRTASSDFPIVNSSSMFQGLDDAFYCKISRNPDSLIYSSLWGGSNHDRWYGVTIDNFGNVYLVGQTSSTGLLLRNEYQDFSGLRDGYLTVTRGNSDDVIIASYFGGTADDGLTDIVLDGNSDLLVSGFSSSPGFPLVNPLYGFSGFVDATITKFRSVQFACCSLSPGNIDCNVDDGVDIADLTVLVDHLFLSFVPLCCEAEANIDALGGIDIADLTLLVDHLFISFTPLPSCP